MAQAAGIRNAHTVRTVEAFRDATGRALAEPGPWFVVAKVSGDSEPSPPKLMDGRENKYRFVRYLEETGGQTILKPSIVGRTGAEQ
jgi:thiamine pyrophosphate-dependent acetolactate synthase large subunit-like protein